MVIAIIGTNPTGFVSLPTAGGEIKIGFIVAQSGTLAVGGNESLKGLLLAEKEINERGGVNGKKLHLIVEDDKSSATDAITGFHKLVNVDGAGIVIGGQTSEEALVIAPLAEKGSVLFFSSTATATKLNDAGEFVFKFQAGNEAHAEKISNAMLALGYKKIGAIYATTEYCEDQLFFLNREFEEKGITKVAAEQYETASTDARTQLLKLQAAQPDAVYMCGFYEDQGRVLKQARELGLEQQFFAVTTIENAKFLEIAGKGAEGVIYTSTTFSCDNANAKQFCEKYEQEFGEKATYRSAYLYDALFVIAKAIEKAGAEPNAVKEELLKTQFNGIAGLVEFDSKGNAAREFMLKTVKDGKFVEFE